MNFTLVVIKFYKDKERIWPGEWIGKYDGEESKEVEGRKSENIFSVEELDEFYCVEKGADKGGEGASKFYDNDENARGLES